MTKDKEVNNILVNPSERLEKNIRTHSFRASIISDFFKTAPVDIVKEVIGHKDIKTTLLYKKRKNSRELLKETFRKVERTKKIGTKSQ